MLKIKISLISTLCISIACISSATIFQASASAANIPEESIIGEWKGSYECSQGKTSLTLKIDEVNGSEVGAEFNFGPHPNNPGVPKGRFRLRGIFEQGEYGKRLRFDPSRWIQQPLGWGMVGMKGDLSLENGTTYKGKITSPRCNGFSLTKSTPIQHRIRAEASESGRYTVTNHIDGDSINVKSIDHGTVREVRMVCIDTPEITAPVGSLERNLAEQAKQRLQELIPKDSEIYLDAKGEAGSGRLGAIVILPTDGEGQGLDINKQLVKEGVGILYPRYISQCNREAYIQAEKSAKSNSRGVWQHSDFTTSNIPIPGCLSSNYMPESTKQSDACQGKL
jgi:endonuclease YncB( thermonuclease family)